MADSKISALVEKTAILSDDDLFVIVDSAVVPLTTKKVLKSTFLNSTTIPVLKSTAGTINKGQGVYLVGFDSGSDVATVELASNASASTMPAFGIAANTITDLVSGSITIIGRASGVNTSAFSTSDSLYIGSTAGTIVNVKPTGTALIQKIGTCVRVDASLGVIGVLGAGRTNDLPNVAQDKIWIGNASGVPAATTLDTDIVPEGATNKYAQQAWLSYSNSTVITTATNILMVLDTDRDSLANSNFTKTTNTTFRADYTGYAEIAYSVHAYSNGTDDRLKVEILKNGVLVPHSTRLLQSKDNNNKSNSCSFSTPIAVTTNDLFTVRMTSVLGNLFTVPIDNANFSIRKI